jgi:hypothetical protein
MASTQLDICNMALGAIGQDEVSTLVGSGKVIRLLNRFYPQIRDEVLESHPWNFAKSRDTLAASVTPPEWEWSTAYDLPSDCIRVLKVRTSDDNQTQPWKVEGTQILTNMETSIPILYIARKPEALFRPLFITALFQRLGAELAGPIAQSASLAAQLAADYEKALRRARSMNAQEGTPDTPRANVFVDAMRGA